MAYKAISKAEAKRFVHEVRKAHDVIIERIYAHKDTVTAEANGLMPKLPDEEAKFFNGKGEWVIPPNDVYTLQSASAGELGGVKIADNTGITIGSSGVISVVPASSSVIGGIKFPTTNLNNTYLRGDGTWAAISLDDYKGPVIITVTENRNTLAQSIAANGITSNILQTLIPNIINIESPNEGDKYLVSNTDPLLDIYEGDYIIYQEDAWRYIKSSGLRSKSLSFKGYIESSQDLEQIATINNDSISSSEIQSNNSAIGNMWLMKTTLGSLEQGDLLLRTGPGTNDWKIIHERPVSSESGGIDFTAGRGLELTSSNILNVDFTDCSGTNAIPAANVVFDITKRADPWTSSLQIQTSRGSYIDIVQGLHRDGIRIGSEFRIFDYYFEEDSGSDDYYYDSGSDDYYYDSGSDDYYYDSGSDDYYYDSGSDDYYY